MVFATFSVRNVSELSLCGIVLRVDISLKRLWSMHVWRFLVLMYDMMNDDEF